jgi:hypothetical protein
VPPNESAAAARDFTWSRIEICVARRSKPAKLLGVSRGKYAERARRSLEVIVLDKKLVASLGGPERVAGILRALAAALGDKQPKR